jgi:hypothetical protein
MLPDLSGTPLPDLLAPAWFLLCWLGYIWFADRAQSQGGLMRTMYAYRSLWARQLLQRDNRMVDTQIIANLMRSMAFFASTTMFIIAGPIAVIGARDRAMAVLAELPFAAESSTLLWSLKVLLLIVVFVYVFFKFAKHFNRGIRARISGSPRSAGSSTPSCSCCSPDGWCRCCTGASSARACSRYSRRPRTTTPRRFAPDADEDPFAPFPASLPARPGSPLARGVDAPIDPGHERAASVCATAPANA